MPTKSTVELLFRPCDTTETKDDILQLVKLGFRVARKTDHQIKIRDVNYYPGTGTITIDPCNKYKDKGFDALLDLLSERFPRPPASIVLEL